MEKRPVKTSPATQNHWCIILQERGRRWGRHQLKYSVKATIHIFKKYICKKADCDWEPNCDNSFGVLLFFLFFKKGRLGGDLSSVSFAHKKHKKGRKPRLSRIQTTYSKRKCNIKWNVWTASLTTKACTNAFFCDGPVDFPTFKSSGWVYLNNQG